MPTLYPEVTQWNAYTTSDVSTLTAVPSNYSMASAYGYCDTSVKDAEGSITFCNNNDEVLKICPDGKIFVKGVEIADDVEAYHALVEFLQSQGMYNSRTCTHCKSYDRERRVCKNMCITLPDTGVKQYIQVIGSFGCINWNKDA